MRKDLFYTTKRFKNVYYENECIIIKDNLIIIKSNAGSDGATFARDEDEILAWLVHDHLCDNIDIPISGLTKHLIMYDILKENNFNMFKSVINKRCPQCTRAMLNFVMIKTSPKIYLSGVLLMWPFVYVWLKILKRK